MRFAFEDQVLDTSQRELRRGGQPVAVEPKVFDLLAYLVENRARVVSKDDVLAAVWGGRIVSESALASCINAARKAVGDSGGEQRLIRTIARKGFRFVGEVGAEDAAPPPADSTPPILPFGPSIAVLRFANLSGDPEQEYFADGVVEDIIAALSRFRSLFVIARNSSFTYAGRGVDVRQVGRELGVRYVLEGSVRRSGGKVRFTAQLIDATTNGHVWADQHDGAVEDLFELQDRITEAVVGVIEPTIRQAEIERVRRKRPDHMGAYDHYLRALSTTNGFTPQAVDASLAAALQAIATDPSFAPAYIFAARAHIQRFVQGWTDDDAANGAAALDFIERGLKVDRFDSWLLATAGHCFVMFARDLPKGLAYTDEAIAINPNLFEAYLHGAWVRLRAGNTRIALDHLQKALRLSPRDLRSYAIYHSLSLAHMLEGDLAAARIWADRSVQHNPNYMSGWYAVAACAALAGQPAQASEATARVLALNPRFSISRWASQPHEPAKFAPLIRGLREAGIPD